MIKHPKEVTDILHILIDESIERGDKPIKLRCQDLFQRLNITTDEDKNIVYEVVSTYIYALRNHGNHIDHDIPKHEMERARLWQEKNAHK